MRLVAVQAGNQAGNVEPGRAAVADLGQRRRRDLRAGQQRGVHPGHVLQQGRQRHQAQVAARRQRRGRIGQRPGHPQQRVRLQAHALGLAGGARSVGDAAGTGRQRHRHRWRRQAPAAQAGRRQRQLQRLTSRYGATHSGDQALRAAAVQRVLRLRRAEEGRQWHVHAAAQADRQVQRQPVAAVVQAAGDAVQVMPLQNIGQRADLVGHRSRTDRAMGGKQALLAAAQLADQLGETGCAHGAAAMQPPNMPTWNGDAKSCRDALSRCRKAWPAAISPNISRGCAA